MEDMIMSEEALLKNELEILKTIKTNDQLINVLGLEVKNKKLDELLNDLKFQIIRR